jgi:hypothetical protein
MASSPLNCPVKHKAAPINRLLTFHYSLFTLHLPSRRSPLAASPAGAIIEQLAVMKKITVIFLIVGLLTMGAYVFVRTKLNTHGFTPAAPKEAAAATLPAESSLDLRPKLIQKLQELVKKGSDGLYNLSVHEVNPDLLKSTVGISHALLVPDTAVMKSLEASGRLPDQVFKIKSDSIWIDGLGLKDLLNKDVIDVKTIHIISPTIEIFSRKKSGDKKNESGTLYQRLMQDMKHIGIGSIVIDNGIFAIQQAGKKTATKFNEISIKLSDVLIDSTTQYDRNRFLFARDAELTMKNYSVPTSNNLYTLKVGSISVKATQQLMMAKNILLQPHYGKEEFQQHIKTMKERYQVSIPSIVFRKTDWWNLLNEERIEADEAEIARADISVYLDRRKPSGGTDPHGFPHQLIMKLPIKINIAKLKVNDLDLSYEEFSKASGKPGKIYVDNLRGTITNLTNLPEAIRKNKTTTVVASGDFMHIEPTELTLHFDLSNYKTGAFTADLRASRDLDGTLVNPVSEPLGLFMVKRGQLNELTSHITGNNYKATGSVTFLYNNLHITPLKKDEDKPSGLKKKSVTSLLANTLVIKDENPSKDGTVRKIDASFTRGSGTFFNLVWKTTFVGILKTIGAPEKLAYE